MIFIPSYKLHYLARAIAWTVIITGGQWLKIKGNVPLKENGPYLYLFNHQSVFDAFMIVASARHYFTGVGAVEQFSYPVWGFLAKKYGLIPIERKKIHSAIGSLAEVENALMSHREIVDAAVVGIPDDKWGEAVKGFVVLSEGADLEESELISYARTQIAAYKCPRTIDFVSELPRNPSGKILRR